MVDKIQNRKLNNFVFSQFCHFEILEMFTEKFSHQRQILELDLQRTYTTFFVAQKFDGNFRTQILWNPSNWYIEKPSTTSKKPEIPNGIYGLGLDFFLTLDESTKRSILAREIRTCILLAWVRRSWALVACGWKDSQPQNGTSVGSPSCMVG